MPHKNSVLVGLLKHIDLGSSVAELDELLQSARVETSAFNDVLTDKVDLVPGTKGSGKSALFRIFPEYLSRTRVFLLLAAAANLEAYMKEIVVIDVLSKGHGELPDKLSSVGEALCAPISRSNSLIPQLKYAQDYFAIDIAAEISRWAEFYKIRSNMAHVGGFATARTLRELPNQGLKIGEVIIVSWDQLKEALETAFDMADEIDRKTFNRRIWDIEFVRELDILKAHNQLPASYEEFERYMHDAYGIYGIDRKLRSRIRFSEFGIC